MKPDGLDAHAYVEPLTVVAPIEVEDPVHIDVLEPAVAEGSAFTVITTLFEELQPDAVTVSVNV